MGLSDNGEKKVHANRRELGTLIVRGAHIGQPKLDELAKRPGLDTAKLADLATRAESRGKSMGWVINAIEAGAADEIEPNSPQALVEAVNSGKLDHWHGYGLSGKADLKQNSAGVWHDGELLIPAAEFGGGQ